MSAVFLLLMLGNFSIAQCTIDLINPLTAPTISCGESVDIEVLGYITGPGLSEDFNGGGLAPGWTTSQANIFGMPCGPTLDGTNAAWFGNVPAPRVLTTSDFDVSCGGQICFDLDFGSDDAAINDCEEPDQINEGVNFQYSIDGITWVDIFYFEPTINGTGPYFTWANYCFDIPAAAYSLNTMFRWSQPASSGANFDHWGIDNFQIFPNSCGAGYYYLWNNQLGDSDTTVGPFNSTNYLVEYTNGIDDTCFINIPLTVEPFNIEVTAAITDISCGDCSQCGVALVPFPSIVGASYGISWTPASIVSSTTAISTSACPTNDQWIVATVTEANSGCWGADSVFITVNPLDPSFSYPLINSCQSEANVLPVITGDVGGEFSAVPAGLDLDLNTGEINMVTSIPGIYDITYIPHANCPAFANFTFEVFSLPTVDAGLDYSICPGDDALLAASGTINYTWDNGVIDNQIFNPTVTTNYTVIGSDNNGCEDTDDVTVSLLVPDDASFDYVEGLDYCIEDANPITLVSGLAGGLFSYTMLNGGILDLNVNSGEVNLSGSDVGTYEIMYNTSNLNLCPDSLTVILEIHANPDPNFTANNLIGCAPQQIVFSSLNASASDQCLWDFGNNQSGVDCANGVVNYDAGTYDVTLTITSEIGCVSEITYTNYVDITAIPEANFSPSLNVTNIEFTDISFNNYSQNAGSYYWSFGDQGANSTEIDPSYTYPEVPEQYTVVLTAYSDNGLCEDSISQIIRVNDILTYYIPNTFTPNGDAFNNEFKPVFTSGFDYWSFHFLIFNRYGEVIFESYSSDEGWDGTYGSGIIVEDGVYIWQVEFSEELSDKKYTQRGHVTVLK
ncbi:MAG: gliding motility-associated-like protein [Arenicella sp.]|jgi:gliding motility-associated-like protein